MFQQVHGCSDVLLNLYKTNAYNFALPLELSEVVLVHPKCGLLPLHLSGGKVSTELIRIEFSPK